MANRYFFISPGKVHKGDLITVDGDEAHHMLHVLRLREGDSVSLLNGKGKVYSCVLKSRSRLSVELEINDVSEASPPRVSIAIGIIREPRLDWAVEKCSEIGIASFLPFTSKRTVWSGNSEKRARKAERLRRKAMAACKQSGQPYLPEINEVIDFGELLEEVKDYSLTVLSDKRGVVMSSIEDSRFSGNATSILGIVGPEGGFEETERVALIEAGAVPVSLGSSTLRSETSACCLAFLLNYELLTRGL